MLIKAYVMIILQIVIAPLQIMLDLIPGQQGFSPWLRNLIANASVFATVPIMLIIQSIFSWSFTVNPWIGLHSFGALGGSSLQLPIIGGQLQSWNIFMQFIVSFVIFTLTPKIADIIRDMLKIPPFKYGTAIGEAFGPLMYGAQYRAAKLDKRYADSLVGGKQLPWYNELERALYGTLKSQGKMK